MEEIPGASTGVGSVPVSKGRCVNDRRNGRPGSLCTKRRPGEMGGVSHVRLDCRAAA